MTINQKKVAIPPPSGQNFEQQLIQYQSRISIILESFTDAFFEVDSRWIVTYWNKEAERLLHMPKINIIGKNLWEEFVDAIPLKFFAEYHKAVKEHIAVRFEEFFAPRNIWVEVAAFPSGDGLSVYFKDITATKNAIVLLQQEKQKYNDLFNLSPVPQWVYDFTTFDFLDVNQAAINHYGYCREEFLTMTIREIRPIEDLAAFEEMHCTDIVPGQFQRSTVRHQKKCGKIIFVCVEGNTLLFEGKNARLVMVIDRTAEVSYVEAIEAQNATLREISWIQSHKVRSPLAKILGIVELMSDNKTDLNSIVELIKPLKLSAEELDQVLREILKKATSNNCS